MHKTSKQKNVLQTMYREMKLLLRQQQSNQQLPASVAALVSDHSEPMEPDPLHDG